jgi:hypothetical protein
MNRLWRMLNESFDARLCHAVYRLYAAIWGRGIPSCTSIEQNQDSATLWVSYLHTWFLSLIISVTSVSCQLDNG